MKKSFIALVMIALMPMLAMAQGWPASYGGVMLQGFFWDSYLENPDFGPNGTQEQRDLGNINVVPHSNPWGSNILHTWATMYDAGWGAGTDDWEVPRTTWTNLEAVKGYVAPFIDLLWLPQSGATIAPARLTFTGSTQTRGMRGGVMWDFNYGDLISNPDANGFVPYLWFDHGKGQNYTYYINGNPVQYTSMTYFGTESELKSLIRAYKDMGCGAIEDVVINHKGFAGDFWFQEDYKDPETGAMTNTNWTKADLVGLIYRDNMWTDWYMPLDGSGQYKQITGGGTGRDDGGYGGWANEVAHTSANAQRNTINYLKYLKEELGYAGFRYDYAAGLAPGRFAQYNTATTPTFSVGEFWTSDPASTFIKNTVSDGHITSAAFDFQLMNVIKNAFNSGYFFDLVDAVNGGMLNDPLLKRYDVTFIANHDTNKDLPTDTSNRGYGNRTNSNIVEANAFILSMPGTPCLFWAHFMHPDWHDPICKMILARRAAGVTNEATLAEQNKVGSNGGEWLVTGTHGQLLLQLGTDAVNLGNRSGFTEVFKSAVCRLAVSNDAYSNVDFSDIYNNVKPNLINGYPVFNKPSGSYNGSVTVNVKPSSAGCTLVYSTNGQNPTANSSRITNVDGLDLTFTETTDLRVGVLLDGNVVNSSIVRNSYVISDDVATSGEIKVYVYDPTGSTPYIYAWNGDDQDEKFTDSWPGWPMNYQKQIGGITWREATIPASKFNMILSENGGSQTHNINNVDHEVFYTFRNGIATDVTSTFVRALHDPMVSIDQASGSYTGNLAVNISSSVQGATLVYTVDRWDTDIEDDGGNQMTSTASNVALTFNTNGSHLVRAAILKDGNYLGKVIRTYQLTGANSTNYQNENIDESGNNYNIFIKASEAPHLYVWDPNNNDAQLNGGWEGNELSIQKRVTDTSSGNAEIFWYYTISKNSLSGNELRFIANYNGDTDKSADMTVTGPGNYFFEYDGTLNAQLTNLTNNYVTTSTTVGARVVPEGGTSIFVQVVGGNNVIPFIWAWKSNQSNLTGGAWPGEQMTEIHLTDGSKWYYWHTDNTDWGGALFSSNGANQTNDIDNTGGKTLTSGDNFYKYYPNGDGWKFSVENASALTPLVPYNVTTTVTNHFTQQSVSEYVAPTITGGIPSCATYLADAQFCYFENTSSMAVPNIWAWNSSKNLSGTSWPGEQLVEMVGVSSTGHAIYRWRCSETGVPTKVKFSDYGMNQTGDFDFVNGGYYTAEGRRGIVPDNIRSLADVIKDENASTTEEFIISDDLELVQLNSDRNCLYLKDKNGNAINISSIQPGQKYYSGTSDFNYLRGGDDFDQSNWVKVLLPQGAELDVNKNYIGHPVKGQTMVGRITDKKNLTLQLSARPVSDFKASSSYIPNVYIPANFVEQSEYFFVTPKSNEYCHVVWACYRGQENGKYVFTVPAKETGVNSADLKGALAVSLDDYEGATPSFTYGNMYELEGIIKDVSTSGSGAPRRINPGNEAPSTTLSLSLTNASGQGGVLTAVEDVTDVVSREVADVKYVNMAGMVSNRPFDGVNIVVTRYTDGSTSTTKILK
ncbi:MAG: starch-binding protein [Muribaculaceae bacterium]|nr:starch-binding protein [Muribaculaceae bacterium]